MQTEACIKEEDCISYRLKDVIKTIGSPIPCGGTREQYKFKDSIINVYIISFFGLYLKNVYQMLS